MLRASVRIVLEQRRLPGDREECRQRERVLVADARKIASRSAVSGTSSAYREAIARSVFASTMPMFDIVVAKERPARMHVGQEPDAVRRLGEPRFDRRPETVPPRQHEPALPPAEDPRDRAQILDMR